MVDLAGMAIDHDPQTVHLRRAEVIADAQPEVEGPAAVDPQVEARHRAGAGPPGPLPAVDLAGVPAGAEESLPHVDEHGSRGREDTGPIAPAGFRIERLAITPAPGGGAGAGGSNEPTIDDGTRFGEAPLFGSEAG